MDPLIPPYNLWLSLDFHGHLSLGTVEPDDLHPTIEHWGTRRTLLCVSNILDQQVIDVTDCQRLQSKLFIRSLRMLDDHNRVVQADIVWCTKLEWRPIDGGFEPDYCPVVICVADDGINDPFSNQRSSSEPLFIIQVRDDTCNASESRIENIMVVCKDVVTLDKKTCPVGQWRCLKA